MVVPNDDLRGRMGALYKRYFEAELNDNNLVIGNEITQDEAGF